MLAVDVSEAPNLKQWFHRHARLPILLTLLAFLGVEGLLLWVVARHQQELQTGVAERLAEVSRVALEEKSTALLQAGFEIATRELGASRAFVCEENVIYALNTPRWSSCEISQKAGYRVIQVPIVRTQEQSFPRAINFNLQVPIFPREKIFYYTLILSLGVCLLGMLLLRRVRLRLENDIFEPFFKNFSNQLKLPIREFEELRMKLRNLNRLSTQAAVTSAILERNAQVAHDIRSPLTALLFAAKDLDSLPQATREAMKSAVKRIGGIVDSLLDKESFRSPETHSNESLRRHLEEIFEEKKFEFRKRSHLDFVLDLESLSETTRTPLEETELKRAVSNLVNNSVEAMRLSPGKIEIGAKEIPKGVSIWVSDDGKSISEEVFSQMGRPGFSQGKKRGQGLGISSAKNFVEKSGGTLRIERKQPQGIRVVLEFHKAIWSA